MYKVIRWDLDSYIVRIGNVSTGGSKALALGVHKHGNPPVMVVSYRAGLSSVLLAIFAALAIGVFLVIFPWLAHRWALRKREVPGFQVLTKRRDMLRKEQ